jgi:tRNA dimethylallyltransferase
MERIWLIAGPTASGKSALALRLARRTGGEIVNADSMQLYGDLRILTARPSPDDEAMAPHHLYGVADAADAWSVGRWLGRAQEVLAQIAGRGRTAIVVGGTGLYFRALTQGLADIPPSPEEVRPEVAAEFATLGEAAFRARLARRDPASAARIGPGDRQRLTRAWEVLVATGRPLSAWQADTATGLAAGSWRGMVLDLPRADLVVRCDSRLRAMLAADALTEVEAIMARDLPPHLPALKALGLREFADHLAGRRTLADALAAAQAATRRYAKRQSTWFRNQTPGWPRVEGPDARDPVEASECGG